MSLPEKKIDHRPFSGDQDKPILWLVVIFLVSRILYHIFFGLHFDASPLPVFYQYIDVGLLKHRLLQSVFYLHSQPPGFNLFLGLVLKLFPLHYAQVFYLIYVFLGLILTVFIYIVMVEIGVSVPLSFVLTTIYMVSPIVVEYENWLFYEYPTAVLVILSLFFLNRFSMSGQKQELVRFFLTLALLIYIRGLFSLPWFLLVIALVWVFKQPQRKTIIAASLLPLVLIFALYWKNWVVFNTFSINEAQLGSTLVSHVVGSLPQPEIKRLMAANKISTNYWYYQHDPDLSQHFPPGLRTMKTGIPVLDQKYKACGLPNPHNLVYLYLGKQDIRDGAYILKHYSQWVWPRIGTVFYRHYFLPADHLNCFYAPTPSALWLSWDKAYKTVFLGKWSGDYQLLALALEFLFAFGVVLIFQSLYRKEYSKSMVFIYMVTTIIYLILGTIIAWTDYPRYRFLVDPFYLIFLGLFLDNLGFRRHAAH